MEKFDLVLDTIYKNGGIILLNRGKIISRTYLEDKNPRSDILLSELDSVLQLNSVSRNQIDKLLLTESLKSTTRNRIFRSFLLGLQDSLNLKSRVISAENILKLNKSDKFNFQVIYASDNEMFYWIEYLKVNNFKGIQIVGSLSRILDKRNNSEVNFTYIDDSLVNVLNFGDLINPNYIKTFNLKDVLKEIWNIL